MKRVKDVLIQVLTTLVFVAVLVPSVYFWNKHLEADRIDEIQFRQECEQKGMTISEWEDMRHGDDDVYTKYFGDE